MKRFVLLTVLLGLLVGEDSLALEAQAYTEEFYNCSGFDYMRSASDFAYEWYDHRGGVSGWSEDGWRQINPVYFADCSKDIWVCYNPTYSDIYYGDEGDAVFVVSHGNTANTDLLFYSCIDHVRYGNSVDIEDEVELGDTDLDLLHVHACGSAQWTDDDSDGLFDYAEPPVDNWYNGGTGEGWGGLDAFYGVHGDMILSYTYWPWFEHTYPDGDDISDKGDEMAVCDAWDEEVYCSSCSDGHEVCPLSIGFGSSGMNAYSNLNLQYDSSFEGATSGGQYVYLAYRSSCEPNNGIELP